MIDDQNLHYEPTENNRKTYKNIRKIAASQ